MAHLRKLAKPNLPARPSTQDDPAGITIDHEPTRKPFPVWRRALNFIFATALTLGGGTLLWMAFLGRHPGILTACGIGMFVGGILWLWFDYILADPRPD